MQIDCRPLYGRSVVEKVTLGQFLSKYLNFLAPLSFHQYITFNFMNMLLLPENEYVTPGNFQKEMLFQNLESTGEKSCVTFYWF